MNEEGEGDHKAQFMESLLGNELADELVMSPDQDTVSDMKTHYSVGSQKHLKIKRAGRKQLNDLYPSLMQRTKLYLKPVYGRWKCNLLCVLLDTLLSWAFTASYIYYVFFASFEFSTNKIMMIMVGTCFTSIFLMYSIFDAIRFLPNWCDKFFYILSCLLQKPILLPIMMPGTCFRSFQALRLRAGPVVPVRDSEFKSKAKYKDHIEEVDRFKIDGVYETQFVLAVQESNFLYSFTLSAFTGATTTLTMCQEGILQETTWLRVMLGLCFMYTGFGIVCSVWLYGRKNQGKIKEKNINDDIEEEQRSATPNDYLSDQEQQ